MDFRFKDPVPDEEGLNGSYSDAGADPGGITGGLP